MPCGDNKFVFVADQITRLADIDPKALGIRGHSLSLVRNLLIQPTGLRSVEAFCRLGFNGVVWQHNVPRQ